MLENHSKSKHNNEKGFGKKEKNSKKEMGTEILIFLSKIPTVSKIW